MRFFCKNVETWSAMTIIMTPETMIAAAITQNTSVSASADKMESKENTRFIATIHMIAPATERPPPLP